ncbi:ferredoxin-NADP reductase [Paucibacter oligotrophus]|uniref:Ferredoxin-NADP reductase n=1 Tax=Roseateles oligotrophus TaxID=1769250 RepID=A0A840L9E6_9BURK|nr:ferredoxin reductase [Roseateles oligotrophus]MBB4845204.1 ferredoxin-NADP reductase [Roseateles oligotrophus]
MLRRWAQPFVDPAVFDYWASHINPLWTWERPLARVVGREEAAAGSVTLVLQPNRHWKGFTPGQHLHIGAEIQGRRITRSYSLSDIPRADGRIAITVQKVDGGQLSTHLCNQTRVGDVLELAPAFGDLVLPKTLSGSLLLLAAGSGITPLMSLTRALAAQNMPRPLTLIYWVKTTPQACFVAELQALAQRFNNFKFQLIATQEGGQRIHAEQLSASLSDDLHALACGPGGFAQTARELLADRAQSFKAEAFTPAVPLNTDSKHQVKVELRRSGRTLEVASGVPLLLALEAQGLRPQSGCRMGICHSCVCTKHEGLAEDINTGERCSEPEAAIRICVSRACTDISLDL